MGIALELFGQGTELTHQQEWHCSLREAATKGRLLFQLHRTAILNVTRLSVDHFTSSDSLHYMAKTLAYRAFIWVNFPVTFGFLGRLFLHCHTLMPKRDAVNRMVTKTAGKRRNSAAFRFHQLDPIAKRIVNENAVIAFERLVRAQRDAGCGQRPGERRQVLDDEGRMGLAGGPEIPLDVEMDLERAALEPAAAPPGEMRRLYLFGDAEQAGVEGPGLGLAAGIASCTWSG